MASSKRHEEATRLAKSTNLGDALRARLLVLGDDGGASYARGEDFAAAAPAAPAAPIVSNPPPTPPALSAREQWRADITRLGRSPNGSDQLRARQLVLQGEPPEPAPAAPAPPAGAP